MAVNDQYRGEFMPGITAGAPNLAAGSTVPRGEDPVIGTPVIDGPYDSAQDTAELDRVSVAAGDTTQGDPAAQTMISPGGPGYTDTGAGHGSTMTNEHGRRPWQQPAGSA